MQFGRGMCRERITSGQGWAASVWVCVREVEYDELPSPREGTHMVVDCFQ